MTDLGPEGSKKVEVRYVRDCSHDLGKEHMRQLKLNAKYDVDQGLDRLFSLGKRDGRPNAGSLLQVLLQRNS